MSTKGASNRYGNAGNGSRGHATKHTGFAWAKDFKSSTLNNHVDKHMKSLGFSSKEEYRAHAVYFANKIDRVNNLSYVRPRTGETVKFNTKTGEFAVITKEGYVTTYYRPKTGIKAYNKDRREHL
ncbi:MAG: hypothetical protein E7386_01625 [Ruminococcaceae bacterium]|nr:hypothetical protein [Oscillospiraceae bacterium]